MNHSPEPRNDFPVRPIHDSHLLPLKTALNSCFKVTQGEFYT